MLSQTYHIVFIYMTTYIPPPLTLHGTLRYSSHNQISHSRFSSTVFANQSECCLYN